MEPVVAKSAPLHRQVEDYVRARIESGDFAPGSKLPSNPALAKLTGTSVFTVQTALARLAKEGLLDRQAKKATLVAGEKKVLTCAGIFLSRPLENQNLRFFQVLNGLLREKLKDAKVNTLVWTDDRTEEEQSQILPSLKKALEKREVQALIVPLMYGTNKVWLEASGVPTAALGFTLVGLNTTIKTSTHEAVREGLRYMKKQGCRSVGLISGMHVRKDRHVPGEVYDFYDEFLATAKKLGLKVQNGWVVAPDAPSDQPEVYGYEQFNKIWDQKERPDGLVVFPDLVARGVLTGVLARGVKVPEDLKLLLHANEEIPYPCPVPAAHFTMRAEELADELIAMIRRQFEGKEVTPVTVPNRFKPPLSQQTA